MNRIFLLSWLSVFASFLYIFSSQSALFGFFAATFLFVLTIKFKDKIQTLTKLVFVAIIFGIVFSPFLVETLYHTHPEFIEYWRSSAAAPQRVDIWHACVREIFYSPFWGHGLYATRALYDNLMLHLPGYRWEEILHPHNFSVQIWLELGVIGVLAFIGFMVFIYNRMEKMPDDIKPYALSFLISIVSISAVGHGMWQSWWLGAILMGVAIFKCHICHVRQT